MWKFSLNLLLAALVAGKIIFLFLCWLVWRSSWRGFGAGRSRMVGLPGQALTDIEREGRVMVQGEYWWARAYTVIRAGEAICVTGIQGMTLEVEPCPDKTLIPRPVSVVASTETEIH